MNLQIISRKLASIVMQCLLASKLSDEKGSQESCDLRTIEVNRPSTKQ